LVGAGLPPALVYRADTGEVEAVPLKGMPLGGPGRARYRKKCVMLSPGDTVVLMTDGFPELFSDRGEMLGYDRAVEVYAEVADRSPEEIIGHFEERGRAWCHGRPPGDDVAFVVMKMKASTDGKGSGTD
jgi:serine phosphatase RsbU (regulator of sigma subunit)